MKRVGTSLLLFTAFLAFSLLVRFSWLFVDEIDPDEGVYILVGQYLSQGHLPYTLAWENKPPLGFVFFSAINSFFNHSLIAVRVGGAVLVAAAAFLVFAICRTFTKTEHALASALFTVVGLSLLTSSAQSVMTEHIAIVPLLAALALFIRRQSPGSYFLTGILLGTATLIRTNLAYVAILAFLATPFLSRSRGRYTAFVNMFSVGAGGLLMLVLTALPYALTGRLPIFLTTVFLVPLDYSAAGLGYLDAAKTLIGKTVNFGAGKITTTYELSLWVGGLIGLLWSLVSVVRRSRPLSVLWLVVFTAGTLASVIATRLPWGHYLLQLVPFFAIGLGLLLSSLVQFQVGTRLATIAVSVAIVATTVVMCRADLRSAIEHVASHGMTEYGPKYVIADYVRPRLKPTQTVFTDYDVLAAYWLLGRTPPAPIAAFPTNIFVRSMTRRLYGPTVTGNDILEDIMSRHPTVLILTKPSIFEQSDAFVKELREDYLLEFEVGDRQVFWRRDQPHASRSNL